MDQQQLEHVVTIPPDTNSSNTHGQSSFQRWQQGVIDITISVPWLCFELFNTLIPILLLTNAFYLSTVYQEHPGLFLQVWVLGYIAGCLVALPLLCLRFPTDYARRFQVVVGRLQMVLYVFFAIWVIGLIAALAAGVWTYDEVSSCSYCELWNSICAVAHRLMMFAAPFIWSAFQCSMISNQPAPGPALVSASGPDPGSAPGPAPGPASWHAPRPAHVNDFDARPTYKFKAKISDCNLLQAKEEESSNFSDSKPTDGGVLAAGTEKERAVTAEDAECCICLSKYRDGVELRELPCTHHFHVECIDEWLEIKASCPICKREPPLHSLGRNFSLTN